MSDVYDLDDVFVSAMRDERHFLTITFHGGWPSVPLVASIEYLTDWTS